jgi:uncharacterized membrane protein
MSADKEFVLERYKYILEQKRFLNKTTFVVISIYQAGLVLILTGYYQALSGGADHKIPSAFACLSSRWVVVLLWVLAAFSISMLIGGLISWFGYRADEAAIEAKYLGGGRARPSFRNLLGWYETYVVLGILLVTAGFTFFLLENAGVGCIGT